MSIDNPYWDTVKDWVEDDPYYGPCAGGLGSPERIGRRFELCPQYAWTITDPATVAFVAEHSLGRLVDPMAGTGYWGWLLAQSGVDVVSFDADPETNHWHKGRPLFATVERLPGVEAAALHADRTLLLAWPPYDTPDGVDVLNAYRGGRVVFIGEGDGGCTGDEALFKTFRTGWRGVAERRPVQWYGIHDYVSVYERAAG